MKATNTSRSNRERKVLTQALKIQLNLSTDKQRIAKGLIKTKTFTMTYLKEYDNARLIKPIEINDFIIPSNENKLNDVVSKKVEEFKLWINAEKQISVLKMLSPIFRITKDSILAR